MNKLKYKSVGVFCSSSNDLDARYYAEAEAIGRLLAGHGMELVYGGSNRGLMESVARGAVEAGGHVVGVVPQILVDTNRVSALPQERVLCRDLNDRKAIIIDRSDILLALPGGVGTLDEMFTVASAHSIGIHSKRVVLYNADGFWDDTLTLLRGLERRHFLKAPVADYFPEARSMDELAQVLGL